MGDTHVPPRLQRYVAQGGGWGAFITTAMAQQQAPGLVAIHLNFPRVIPDHIPDKLSPDQQRAIEILNRFRSEGSGYRDAVDSPANHRLRVNGFTGRPGCLDL